MQIVLFNFNVKGGIEYQGEEIHKILKKITNNIIVYKNQNPPIYIYEFLIKHKPNIIVLNEPYYRTIEAIWYYKKTFNNIKIINFFHGNIKTNTNNQDQELLLKNYINISNLNFILSPENKTQYIDIPYMLVDPNEYKITIPWNKRKPLAFIQRLIPQKFSEDIRNNKPNNINIDCYFDEFKGSSINCNNFDAVNQNDMPNVLNKYKYNLFAFDNKEIFSITLLQSILCGSIPLIYLKDPNYIKWANGLYFSDNNKNTFWNNVKNILQEDMSDLSYMLREKAIKLTKYDYYINYIYTKIKKLIL